MKPVGVVVGLAAEARLARRWGVPVAIGGGGAVGAARAAEDLAPHVSGLVSFGLAGGLDPALKGGTVIIPAQIVDREDRWSCDSRLIAVLGGCTGQTLLGGGEVLATRDAKQRAWRRGLHAVDLESAAVARAARQHGLPFAALRAICDEAGRELPAAALIALDEAGRIQLSAILGSVLRRPRQIPALIALAGDAQRARVALRGRVQSTRMLREHT